MDTAEKTRDGLKLLVQFYDNHGCLRQVSERSGIGVSTLRSWLDCGTELPAADRQKLEVAAEKGGSDGA